MKTFAETEISFPPHAHPPSHPPPPHTAPHLLSFHSFANFYSSTVPSVASDAGALSSSLFSTGTVWSEIRWHISIVPLRTTGTSPLLAVCQTLQEAGKTGDVCVVTTVCGCFKLLKCPVKWTDSRHRNTQPERTCNLNIHSTSYFEKKIFVAGKFMKKLLYDKCIRCLITD